MNLCSPKINTNPQPTMIRNTYSSPSPIVYVDSSTESESISPTSVGEVWFGSVWGTFCQTGNQTVRFFSDFQKLKPKPHQTVRCGFKWFQTQFKPKPFKKKNICNNLFTLHNFVVYLLQIYLIYIKLHIDGCPEEKR